MQHATELGDSRWMTLMEVIELIESTLSVGSISAQVAVKTKIGSRELPVKWADAKDARDVPDTQELARSKLILSTPGLAPDELVFRPLLILRSAVHTAWKQGGNTTFNVSKNHQAVRHEVDPWMSLVEAAEHIQIVEGCDSIEALRRLKTEIGDGLVQVRWQDPTGVKDLPNPRHLKVSQFLLVGVGFAPDNDAEEYRPLLVERSSVQRLWPFSKQQPQGSYRSSDIQTPKGRPSVRKLVCDTLLQMRNDGRSLTRNHKALATEIVKTNGKVFGAPGWGERTVLKHVSDWLKEDGRGGPTS